jgi:hypothetical protein
VPPDTTFEDGGRPMPVAPGTPLRELIG